MTKLLKNKLKTTFPDNRLTFRGGIRQETIQTDGNFLKYQTSCKNFALSSAKIS